MFNFEGLKQFSNSVNAEEIEKAIASEGKSKTFEPGTYTMKITAIDYHKSRDTGKITCAKDPSWFNVVATLTTEDGRTKQHFVQVPTVKLTYAEGTSKAPYFSFRNLVKFMEAIGVELSVENAAEVISKFFAGDGTTLTGAKLFLGQKVTVDMGYKGNHVTRNEDGTFSIKVKNNYVLDENDVPMKFPDRDAAKLHGVTTGLGELNTFTEILNFQAGEYIPMEKPKPTLAKTASPW